jgi:uncharacterized glyoxalase superfamily protein PhnB
MVGGASPEYSSAEKDWRDRQASPQMVGGKNTQSICIFVDDVDAHCARARAAGATISREPKTDDYGDDDWAIDPEGHHWWFMQRIRDQKVK